MEAGQLTAGRAGDLALARLAAGGDREAAGRLVDACAAAMRRAALAALRGAPNPEAAAEDAVSEAFLRAFEDGGALLKAYRGESSLPAYLAAVAFRAAVDIRRREGRMVFLPFSSDGPASAPEPEGPDPRLAWLESALLRLSPPDREILTLRYLEGLSFREMASLLDVPLGTAAARLARARERLKKGFQA